MADVVTAVSQRVEPFESASALREAHARLLEALDGELGQEASAEDETSSLARLETSIRQFLERGGATGVYLEEIRERTACQVLLDYWVSSLRQAGIQVSGVRLARFDGVQLPDLQDKPCPYVGLEAFRDQTFFFGREADTQTLLKQVRDVPLVIVSGASGSGKSSLVMGGVLPALAAELCIVPPFVPGNTVLDALAHAVLQIRAGGSVADEAARLRQDPRHLCTMLGGAGVRPTLLTIDQFEEVFTLSDLADREVLVAQLAQLLEAGLGHRVILTMREEFRNRMAELRALDPYRGDKAWYSMRPMSYEELKAAVERPATLVNLQFQAGVVDDLVKKVLGQPAALPLLQFTLRELWKNRRRNRITEEVYRQVGDPLKALNTLADAFYYDLLEEAKREVKRILLELVRVDELLEAYRQPVPKSRLMQAGQANTEAVLRLLAEHDYVRITSGASETDPVVEVKHESLIRNWQSFVDWIDEKRRQRRERLVLTEAAKKWAANGKPQEGLLTGWQAQEEARGQSDLSALEREFVQASTKEVDRLQQEKEAARREKEAARQHELEQAQDLATAQRERADAQAAARRRQQRFNYILIALLSLVVWFAWYALAQRQVAVEQRQVAVEQRQVAVEQRQVAVAQQKMAEAQQKMAEVQQQVAEVQQKRAEAQQQVAEKRQLIAMANNELDRGGLQRAFLLFAAADYGGSRTKDSAQQSLQQSLQRALATQPQLRKFLSSHQREVYSVAFSRDGTTLASASSDGTVILWDVAEGTPRGKLLEGHQGPVYSVAFSRDGTTLASASSDGTVILWDVAKGTPRGKPLKGHQGPVRSIAFSRDGTTLASASSDGTVILWDVAKGTPRGKPLEGHQRAVHSVAFSPDGTTLASASSDGTVILWDVAKRTPRGKPLKGHQRAVYSVAFSPDGTTLASASSDTTVRLWDVAKRTPRGKPLKGHQSEVYSVAFTPDGTTFASANSDGTVILWDVAKFQGKPLEGHQGPVYSVAFSRDGTTLASASSDGTVILWDVAEGTPRGKPLKGHQGPVYSVAFSRDGTTLASASSDGTVILWDVAKRTPRGKPLKGHQGPVRSIAFTSDGTTLASASSDGTVILWDVAEGTPGVSPLRGISVRCTAWPSAATARRSPPRTPTRP